MQLSEGAWHLQHAGSPPESPLDNHRGYLPSHCKQMHVRGRSSRRSGNWQSLQALMLTWVEVFAVEQCRCRVCNLIVKCEEKRGVLVGSTLWIWGKILNARKRGGVEGARGFARCSVLVYLSLASAEAVTQRLEQSCCHGGRLENRSVGAETLSSRAEAGGEHLGIRARWRGGSRRRRIYRCRGGAKGMESFRSGVVERKEDMASSGMEKVGYEGRVRYVKAPVKGDEGDSLDRRELRG